MEKDMVNYQYLCGEVFFCAEIFRESTEKSPDLREVFGSMVFVMHDASNFLGGAEIES